MADLLCCKLIHSPSIDFTRFRAPSLPPNLSLRFSFTILRFSSPRLKSFPAVLADPSSHSTPTSDSRFGIISSTECSDGSVLFKFGDTDIVENIDHEDDTHRVHEVSMVSEVVDRESRSSASVSNIKEHHGEVVDERLLQPMEVMMDDELKLDENVEETRQMLGLAVLNEEKYETLGDSAAGLMLDVCLGGDANKERNNETAHAKRDMKNLRDTSVLVDSEQSDILDTAASVDSNDTRCKNSIENLHDCLLVDDGKQSGIIAPTVDDHSNGDAIKKENNGMTSLKSDVEDIADSHMVDASKQSDALATTASVDDHFIGDVIKEENNELTSSKSDTEDVCDFHMVDDGMQSDILATTASVDDHFSGGAIKEENNEITRLENDVENLHDFHLVDDIEQSDIVATTSKFGFGMDDEKIIDSAEVIEEIVNKQPSPELELVSEASDSSETQAIDEISAPVEPSAVSLPIGDNKVDDSVNDFLSASAASQEEQIADSVAITVGRTPSSVLVGTDAPPGYLQGETDVDVENNDAMEGSDPKLDSVKIFSAGDTIPRVEISRAAYFLSSGAASLPHPSKALTGVEDAHFVAFQSWFGVAGGVGNWSFKGNLDGHYAQELMRNCEQTVYGEDIDKLSDVKEVLKRSAAAVQSPGSATVLIAYFDHQVLHVANIGDTGFCLIRNGFVYQKSCPREYEFNFPFQIGRDDDPLEVLEEYCVDVDDGDMIITATDGLFDNLYEEEIASIVSKTVAAGMKPKEIAELLATRAQEVGMLPSGRTPFADAAQAAGYTGYSGSKLDAVTVIVSLVLNRSTPSL